MSAFLRERKTAIESMINAYEAAIIAISTDGVQSYTLDTGQTNQVVTKLDLTRLQNKYESLLALHQTICKRLGEVSSGTIVRPNV